MNRLKFDSQGKLSSVDGKEVYEDSRKLSKKSRLMTSESLDFMQEGKLLNKNSDRFFWSLYSDSFLQPLSFSNRKTQEDIVKEIYNLIKEGNKVIFLHGACGTGKSAIALNLARVLGRASVVVPVKALQSQYEKDYTKGKYIIKHSGEKMNIAIITGRENHDSLIKPGVSCADSFLPDTIKITEKNFQLLAEYYKLNPFIRNNSIYDLKKIRRISIAPANPYWSPIIPADYEATNLIDATKYNYRGCDGKEYVFYHRKKGCSYYDQYLAYITSEIIIFNSAKYNSEINLGRKPLTDVDIIDEADVFLDSFFEQSELNLSWLANSLKNLNVDSPIAEKSIEKITELIYLEEKNKQATGIDESKIFKIEETKLAQVMKILDSDLELQSEIAIDELNYSNRALEIAKDFSNSLKDIYLNYRKEEGNLIVKIVSANFSYKLNDLLSKTKALVFMSGTLHSKEVLENIFKIKGYKVVEAETLNPGSLEIIMTGKEIDCRYENFASGKHSRKEYLSALSVCVDKTVNPALIHVQAFQDLPSESEILDFGIKNLISREELIFKQQKDSFGSEVDSFKKGVFPRLFSTKCSRGVDFPGDICRSVVFTKYPNPNMKDLFWKIIKQTCPNYYWEFYKDKAKREFLQKLYRAIRSKNDHVYVLSPDARVLREARLLQQSRIAN